MNTKKCHANLNKKLDDSKSSISNTAKMNTSQKPFTTDTWEDATEADSKVNLNKKLDDSKSSISKTAKMNTSQKPFTTDAWEDADAETIFNKKINDSTTDAWEEDTKKEETEVINEEINKKENDIKTAKSFDEMNIPNEILRSIYAAGYETPATCQQVIPELRESFRDAIISAQAGSGKTLLFSIVALCAVNVQIKNAQVVILSPTRELALQTFAVICSIATYSNVSIALHRGVGTKTKKEDISPLLSKTIKSESYMSFGVVKEGLEQIIVATPGKLFDIITNEKGIKIGNGNIISKINMKFISMFIMDEADELLSPHNEFQDLIGKTFSNIPTIDYTQKIIVSATITPSVIDICDRILVNPLKILIKKEEVPLTAIKQFYVALVQEQDKLDCLLDIYKNATIGTAMVFTNQAAKAEHINNVLKEEGFTVAFIHARLPQFERDNIMKDFRSGKIRILITTDLLTRGIDVQSVSVVFNYDLPTTMENYIHRVGRCGRFGKIGVAINFVIETYNSKPKDIVIIEKHYNIEIKPLPASLEALTRI